MARVRMVTRTIAKTTAHIMTVSIPDGVIGSVDFVATGDVPDDILKVAKKSLETETLKLVAVTSTDTAEELYGMPEVDFLKVAKKLPPRQSKES